MLYYKTIDNHVLELLIKLLKIPEFNNMRLVGGTALALQIGHRKSVDINLFGTLEADYLEIEKKLSELGKFIVLKNSKNINIYLLNGIKVDIVNYPYLWIDEPLIEQEIIMAGKKRYCSYENWGSYRQRNKKRFYRYLFFDEAL